MTRVTLTVDIRQMQAKHRAMAAAAPDARGRAVSGALAAAMRIAADEAAVDTGRDRNATIMAHNDLARIAGVPAMPLPRLQPSRYVDLWIQLLNSTITRASRQITRTRRNIERRQRSVEEYRFKRRAGLSIRATERLRNRYLQDPQRDPVQRMMLRQIDRASEAIQLAEDRIDELLEAESQGVAVGFMGRSSRQSRKNQSKGAQARVTRSDVHRVINQVYGGSGRLHQTANISIASATNREPHARIAAGRAGRMITVRNALRTVGARTVHANYLKAVLANAEMGR